MLVDGCERSFELLTCLRGKSDDANTDGKTAVLTRKGCVVEEAQCCTPVLWTGSAVRKQNKMA